MERSFEKSNLIYINNKAKKKQFSRSVRRNVNAILSQISHEATDGSGESLIFGPAFNYDFLLEVFQLQQQIEQLGQADGTGLDRICFAPVTQAGADTRLQDCTVQSIFGYFGNSLDNVRPSNYLNVLDRCMR